jgi:hypothetical protein
MKLWGAHLSDNFFLLILFKFFKQPRHFVAIEILRQVTPCSSIVRYQRFGGTYNEGFLHDGYSSFLGNVCTWLWNYTIQKAVIIIFTIVIARKFRQTVQVCQQNQKVHNNYCQSPKSGPEPVQTNLYFIPKYIVTFWWLYAGFRLLIGLTGPLKILTASNYNALANSRTRLLITVHAVFSVFLQ